MLGDDNFLKPHILIQEPHENGPLFSELSYYRRVAKEEKSEALLVFEWAENSIILSSQSILGSKP